MTHPQQPTREVLEHALACIKSSTEYATGNPAYEQAECNLIALLAHPTPSTAGERKQPANGVLFDSQWVNIVNAPEVLDAIDKEEAVNKSVKLAEKYFKQNLPLLQSTTLPATDMPKIGCVQHDCAECQARAALPVGELTDEQIEECWKNRWETAVSTVERRRQFARTLLAVARSQPVLEPLPEWVLVHRRGLVPLRKGPFLDSVFTAKMLRELYELYPDCICSVIKAPNETWPESGVEYLQQFDIERGITKKGGE